MTSAHLDPARDPSLQPAELLLEPDGQIDLGASLIAFRRLLGQIATETNETPRTILEEEFKQAPPDEFWRATIGAER